MENKVKQVAYRSTGNYRLVSSALKQVTGPISGLGILDLGCGNGLMSGWLAKQNNVVGVDQSTELLKSAMGRGLLAVQSDIRHTPGKEQAFDLVVSIETVQHLPDIKPFLDSVVKYTKPGGKIIISTICSTSLIRRLYRYSLAIQGRLRDFAELPILRSPDEFISCLSELGCDTQIMYIYHPFMVTGKLSINHIKTPISASGFFVMATRQT